MDTTRAQFAKLKMGAWRFKASEIAPQLYKERFPVGRFRVRHETKLEAAWGLRLHITLRRGIWSIQSLINSLYVPHISLTFAKSTTHSSTRVHNIGATTSSLASRATLDYCLVFNSLLVVLVD